MLVLLWGGVHLLLSLLGSSEKGQRQVEGSLRVESAVVILELTSLTVIIKNVLGRVCPQKTRSDFLEILRETKRTGEDKSLLVGWDSLSSLDLLLDAQDILVGSDLEVQGFGECLDEDHD